MIASYLIGSQLESALAHRYQTERRFGRNRAGISVKYSDLGRFNVCHINVELKTDRITGFYFSCETDIARAKAIAGQLCSKLKRWRLDQKASQHYVEADFVPMTTLSDVVALIDRALENHPKA